MASKQVRLTLAEKHRLIELYEAKTSKAELSRIFKISKPSVGYIINQKEKIAKQFSANPNSKRKSIKGAEKNQDIDEPLLQWFMNMRGASKELNSATILEAAKQAARRFGRDPDTVNESWLQRWRERHGIRYVALHGESAECPNFENWLDAIQATIEKYQADTVFNMDETALFWRMQSSKTFVGPDEQEPRGRKPMKTRVTLLVCCSMAGEKLPLLCVGSSKNPRWPTIGGRKATPPLKYCSSRKGWMTTAIFSDCLKDFEQMLKSRNQKGLLLLDNCPAHKGFEERYDGVKTNLEVKMLPPNTSSKLQPCDQGVIRSLKAHYRGKLARLLIHKAAKDVTLYEGLQMVRAAWANNVTEVTIKNAWLKSGIRKEQIREQMDTTDCTLLENQNDLEQLAAIEDKEPVAETTSLDIDSIIDCTMEEQKEYNLDSDEESIENSPAPPSVSECLKMMDLVSKRFILSSGDEPVCVTDVKQALMCLPKSQSLITDFFC